jgi:hypothetical protein
LGGIGLKILKVFLGVGVSLSCLLAGCSYTKSDDTAVINETTTKLLTSAQEEHEKILEFGSVTERLDRIHKVSLISPDGTEISLDTGPWFEKIKTDLQSLRPIQTTIHNYDYTMVLWPDEGIPFILQIGEESIQIGDQTYSLEAMQDFISTIQNEIGINFFSNLMIDQINIFSLDVANGPIELESTEFAALKELLMGAEYQERKPDIPFPLFPRYVVQVMDGGKSVINLEVISSNLIAFPYGNQYIYFKVEENLYDRFFALLPPLDYLDENPKSLFYANAITIKTKDEEKEIRIGKRGMSSPQADSICDYFARLLIAGTVQEDKPAGDEVAAIRFIFADQEREVRIYEDGYFYASNYYELPGIGKRVTDDISEIFH